MQRRVHHLQLGTVIHRSLSISVAQSRESADRSEGLAVSVQPTTVAHRQLVSVRDGGDADLAAVSGEEGADEHRVFVPGDFLSRCLE